MSHLSEITLVRHGQANTNAQDEASYDVLSDLGHQQAAWLGDYLGETGERFARVYTGTMRRHRETAQSMRTDRWGAPVEDARLNEVNFFDLSDRVHAQLGIAAPDCPKAFVDHFSLVFTFWQEGKIEGAYESYHDFQSRIEAVLAEIAAGDGRALVVTSGGLIAMALRLTMGLDLGVFSRLALSIHNTSLHRLHPVGDTLTLTGFNAVPHLASPDRHGAQTFM